MGVLLDRQTAKLTARLPRWFGPAFKWSLELAMRSSSIWPVWARRLPLRVLAFYVKLCVLAGLHD